MNIYTKSLLIYCKLFGKREGNNVWTLLIEISGSINHCDSSCLCLYTKFSKGSNELSYVSVSNFWVFTRTVPVCTVFMFMYISVTALILMNCIFTVCLFVHVCLTSHKWGGLESWRTSLTSSDFFHLL